MSKESRDYLEMSFRSIDCFTNDGKLTPAELTPTMLARVLEVKKLL